MSSPLSLSCLSEDEERHIHSALGVLDEYQRALESLRDGTGDLPGSAQEAADDAQICFESELREGEHVQHLLAIIFSLTGNPLRIPGVTDLKIEEIEL